METKQHSCTDCNGTGFNSEWEYCTTCQGWGECAGELLFYWQENSRVQNVNATNLQTVKGKY